MPLSATSRAKGVDALIALTVAAEKCGEVVQEIERERDELLAKCTALERERDELETSALQAKISSDSYVVLLIDAHSHKFSHDLMGNRLNGGAKAAKLLKAAVHHYLSGILPHLRAYRVVARVYMLPEKIFRASFFTGAFARQEPFFEVIDGVDEDVVRAKITGSLKVEICNPQCQHIFLCTRYAPAFTAVLKTYPLIDDKVTFVQGERTDEAFSKEALGLNYIKFLHIFRCAADGDKPANTGSPIEGARSSTSEICKYYNQKGGCTRKGCWYKHCTIAHTSPQGNIDWSRTPQKLRQLPTCSRPGLIPVNSQDKRLDTYLRPPTKTQWAKYGARYKIQKLCSNFYLQGECGLSHCEYDHQPVDSDILYCVQYALRGVTCSQRSSCRRLRCVAGHICLRELCANGKVKGCRIHRMLHEMDYKPAKWVRSTDDPAVIYMSRKDNDEVTISVNKTVTPVANGGVPGDFDPDTASDESDEVDIGFWKRDSRPSTPSNTSRANTEAPDSDLLNDDSLDAMPAVPASQGPDGMQESNYDEDAPLIDL